MTYLCKCRIVDENQFVVGKEILVVVIPPGSNALRSGSRQVVPNNAWVDRINILSRSHCCFCRASASVAVVAESNIAKRIQEGRFAGAQIPNNGDVS
jgi:hypothetical protein